MTLSGNIAQLAERLADEFNAVRGEKADRVPGAVELTATSGVITPDVADGVFFRHHTAVDVQLAEPVGGADTQTIRVEVTATADGVELSFAGGIIAPVPIPDGMKWVGYLTRDQAAGQWTLDDGASGVAGTGGGVGGGGTVPDATTTTKGQAVLLGGTADAPTVPASAITGVLDDARIPAGIARDSEVAAAVAALVDSAPGTLDTLGELATQLAGDESAAAALATTVGGKLAKTANLSDLADPAAARTNLGLGASATRAVGTTAGTVAAGDDARLSDARTPTAHTHGVTDLTATGTRSAATYLRGDNTWATPSGGGTVADPIMSIVPPVGGAITMGHTNTSTVGTAIGTLVLGLMTLPPATYDAVIFRVNSPNASATAKVVAYNVAAAGGLGALLFETTAAAATSGGNVVVTLPSNLVVSSPGLAFWVGVVNQGTAAATFWGTGQGYGVPRVNASASGIDLGGTTQPAGIQITGVTGAAPTSPTYTWDASPVPRIAFRRSA